MTLIGEKYIALAKRVSDAVMGESLEDIRTICAHVVGTTLMHLDDEETEEAVDRFLGYLAIAERMGKAGVQRK